MKEYIEKQQAIDALKGLEFCVYMDFGEYIGEDIRETRLIRAEKAQDALQNLPSAQPERKTGHWIAITSWNNTYKCSVCGRLLVNITDGKNKVAKNYPYCHCGADMRGEEHE